MGDAIQRKPPAKAPHAEPSEPSLSDLARLAAQLGMSVREFRDAYCDLDMERKWARYGDLD
jgi:hypothetical protein